MLRIVPIQGVGVAKNGGSFLERDAVLLPVAQGLPGVPREHICVYTLIGRGCKEGTGIIAFGGPPQNTAGAPSSRPQRAGGFEFSFRVVRGPCSVGFQADIFVFRGTAISHVKLQLWKSPCTSRTMSRSASPLPGAISPAAPWRLFLSKSTGLAG